MLRFIIYRQLIKFDKNKSTLNKIEIDQETIKNQIDIFIKKYGINIK